MSTYLTFQNIKEIIKYNLPSPWLFINKLNFMCEIARRYLIRHIAFARAARFER